MIVGIMRDGGMADELLVPPRCLVPLPAGVAARDACLVEPLAVCVHGMRKIGLHGGQRVAVVGAGSIGLLAVAAAHAAGAEVGLVARHQAQAAAGERLGAKPADGEYDVVVECAGTESALQTSCELAKPGATLLLLSSYWDGLSLPGFIVMLKELRVQHKGRPFRVFFAFDPLRQAVMLCGGDKTGDKHFYATMIPIAEQEFLDYLQGLE